MMPSRVFSEVQNAFSVKHVLLLYVHIWDGVLKIKNLAFFSSINSADYYDQTVQY